MSKTPTKPGHGFPSADAALLASAKYTSRPGALALEDGTFAARGAEWFSHGWRGVDAHGPRGELLTLERIEGAAEVYRVLPNEYEVDE